MSLGSPVGFVVAGATTVIAGKLGRVFVAKKFAAAELTAGPVPPRGAHSASASLWISVNQLSVTGILQNATFHLDRKILQPRGFAYGDVQEKDNSISRNQR